LTPRRFRWFNRFVLISQKVVFACPSLAGVALALTFAAAPAFAQSADDDHQPSTRLSGYMDFHYNKPELADGRLDFHRFVLLVTHEFSPKIRFVGELELEHAFVEGLEEGGELELEQAYVDFLLSRGFNVRAGMLLMPIGILNERHEPPVYYGVERTFVDTVIVPSTWFEVGAGVHGEVGRGWRYRLFVTSPLNALEFSADEGLRNGRQKGSDTNIGRAALTGRAEYVGVRGLTTGVSFWTGKSGFELRPRLDVPVHLIEADARYSRNRLELRAQIASVSIDNAAELNDVVARTTGVDPNIARTMRGAYAEASYRVIEGQRWGDVGVFARYENFDTQFRMPAGAVPIPAFDRDAWVVGASYWPEPDIAVKVDYVIARNQSSVVRAPNALNIGLGWWF
jgi:hypothetical protein